MKLISSYIFKRIEIKNEVLPNIRKNMRITGYTECQYENRQLIKPTLKIVNSNNYFYNALTYK